ncbi:hypothetical protein GCM10009610_43360 [Pseudonocardia xinjiangensis]
MAAQRGEGSPERAQFAVAFRAGRAGGVRCRTQRDNSGGIPGSPSPPARIDGTIPGVLITTMRVRLVLSAALAAPALLVAGCSAGVPGTPAPQSGGTPVPPVPAPAPQGPTPESPADDCSVTVQGPGRISMTGSGRVSTRNGASSVSCGTGPLVGITTIGDDGVSFSAADGAATTVAEGATTPVGQYQISVLESGAGAARIRIVPQG